MPIKSNPPTKAKRVVFHLEARRAAIFWYRASRQFAQAQGLFATAFASRENEADYQARVRANEVQVMAMLAQMREQS